MSERLVGSARGKAAMGVCALLDLLLLPEPGHQSIAQGSTILHV